MLRRIFAAAAVVLLLASPVFAQLKMQPFVTGLAAPVAFIQDPTDATVQYVVQQNGHIRVVKSGVLQPTDFLDVSTLISCCGERGLLGLAFEPGDVTDRRFYVYFTNTDGNVVIARFLRSTGNRLIADASTFFPLQWPTGPFIPHTTAGNHNGGTLAFGFGGFLYIGVGDGGGGNDQFRNSQNPNTLLGKMLRVDVRGNNPNGYVVPPTNPFLDSVPIAALGEIWSFGLRNPWKFSIDDPSHGGTGGILIADVGQSSFEEVNYEPSNKGARNYGWAFYEGNNHPGDPGDTLAYGPVTFPMFEYTHAEGISISGGNVYRGTQLGPAYAGRYFFGDLNGRVWSIPLKINGTGEADPVSPAERIEHTGEFGGTSTLGNVVGFGVDASAELYIVGYSKGTIFKILSAAPTMFLDAPVAGVATQPFSMAGWAIDRRATSTTGVDAVHLWALPSTGSPTFLGAAPYGGSRPDIGNAFGSQFTNSAFAQTIRGLRPGAYTLTANAHSSITGTFADARAVNVTVRNNPVMVNDIPADGARVGPNFTLAGWALDFAASSGVGVDAVHVWAFPSGGGSPTFLGAASIGFSRPDVGAAFGGQFTNSGYRLTVSNLALGTYQISVFARSVVSGGFDNVRNLNVTVGSDPLMVIDQPVAGSVTRPFFVRGWAIDRSASSGSGVNAVHVWAFPVSGGPSIFVGAATTGLTRVDVGNAFGAQFTNSGYSLTVNSLSPGTYDLGVYASSTVAGGFNNVRFVRVTVQ